MPDGVRGQYCVSALTDTQTISCAKEQTEKTVFKSVGANLKTVGFSLRTLYNNVTLYSILEYAKMSPRAKKLKAKV
jgi:hypothetical protein